MTQQRAGIAGNAYGVLGSMVFILSALVLFFLLAGRPFWVHGVSMEPTLQDGQLLLVHTLGGPPQQGDIVVLHVAGFRDEPIVKRVIAVGGQTVSIDYADGTVTVNGEVLDEPYLNGEMARQPNQTVLRLTVPEGHLFVMGDNRNQSADSRDPACGPVDVRLVLGRAAALPWAWWSLSGKKIPAGGVSCRNFSLPSLRRRARKPVSAVGERAARRPVLFDCGKGQCGLKHALRACFISRSISKICRQRRHRAICAVGGLGAASRTGAYLCVWQENRTQNGGKNRADGVLRL